MTNTNTGRNHMAHFVEFLGIGIGTPPYCDTNKVNENLVLQGSHFRTVWPDGTPWHQECAPRSTTVPATTVPGAREKGTQIAILGGYGISTVYLFQDLVTALQERFPQVGVTIVDIPGGGGNPRNMRAAEDDEIENCIADTLTSSLKETDRDIIVITFSTAGLFLKPALVTIANQGLDLNRIIGVSAISLPLGVRRPENEVLARLVEFVEHYGPTKPIAHIGDYIWIKIAARRPEGNTPTKLNDIPQTEWYPLRATATIIAQGLKLRDSSLLPASLSTTPQLVIHGSRDGKCPPGPVWKLVETLIANGHRIQQLELPGSGHAVPLGKDAALFEEKFIKWCEAVLTNQNLESL